MTRGFGMLKSIRLTAAAAILLGAAASQAQLRFEAPLNSSAHHLWSVQASQISCVLSYAFPEYGRADFVLLSGPEKQLSLEIFPLLALDADSQMRAVATPPAWKYNGGEQELGRIKLYRGFNPFFGNTVAWRILGQLSKGNQIMLPFTDTKRLQGETVVPILSPMGFNKPFQHFLNCQNKLLDYGFNDVQMLALHFVEGRTFLNHESDNAIKRQINYIKQDKAISSISVRTFAFEKDNREDNLQLAKERAEALVKIYTDAGIDPKLILQEHIADRQMNSRDLTLQQRRDAARAVITLTRDPYKIDRSHEVSMPDVGVEHAAD